MDPTKLVEDAYWQGESLVVFETSGSSGVPKKVVLSKQALLASAAAVNAHLAVTAESKWGLALPLHHVGGFGVMARAYQAKCAWSHFSQRWDAPQFRHWLENEKVTHTSLVPTQVYDFVKHGQQAPAELRAIVVGGGQLSQEIGQAARDLGWPVLASFGMTEAGSQIATQTLDHLHQPYQPFPLPLLPIWQCQLTGDQTLAISGPALFSGYICDGIYQAREDPWHQTTDRVSLENGFLSPISRADQWVKILGELVDPMEIEQRLISQSAGKFQNGQLVILALPHPRRGHILVPVLEGVENEELARHLLQAHAQQEGGLKQLAPHTVLPTFPRSPLGKVRRGELIALIDKN